MENDTVFEIATSSIRYGRGATAEVGMDLADRGVGRVLVITDPNLKQTGSVETVLELSLIHI